MGWPRRLRGTGANWPAQHPEPQPDRSGEQRLELLPLGEVDQDTALRTAEHENASRGDGRRARVADRDRQMGTRSPAPPQAMTGTSTASLTARISSRS